MGLLSFFGLGSKDNRPSGEETAEDFIREHTALHRHYSIEAVQEHLHMFTDTQLTDDEVINVVQRIRNEKGYGPIKDYNLPGYTGEW